MAISRVVKFADRVAFTFLHVVVSKMLVINDHIAIMMLTANHAITPLRPLHSAKRSVNKCHIGLLAMIENT
jgi:hypothetical protein